MDDHFVVRHQNQREHCNVVRQTQLTGFGMARMFTGMQYRISYFARTAFESNGVGSREFLNEEYL